MSPSGKKVQYHKTKLCPWNSRAKCYMGDRCNYAHSRDELRPKPDLTNTKLCPDVQKGGKCERPGCRFAHEFEELRATHAFYKTKLCKWWLKGGCPAGEECRHAHGLEELRDPHPQDVAKLASAALGDFSVISTACPSASNSPASIVSSAPSLKATIRFAAELKTDSSGLRENCAPLGDKIFADFRCVDADSVFHLPEATDSYARFSSESVDTTEPNLVSNGDCSKAGNEAWGLLSESSGSPFPSAATPSPFAWDWIHPILSLDGESPYSGCVPIFRNGIPACPPSPPASISCIWTQMPSDALSNYRSYVGPVTTCSVIASGCSQG